MKFDEAILLNQRIDTIARHAASALKVGAKYDQEWYRNAKVNYDTLYREYTDLQKITEVTAEVQQALKRRDMVAPLQERELKHSYTIAITDRVSRSLTGA